MIRRFQLRAYGEERAVLSASSKELAWAAPGNAVDPWRVRLVPPDRGVAAPPGFDGTEHRVWVSLTPYVPPAPPPPGRKATPAGIGGKSSENESYRCGALVMPTKPTLQWGSALWVAVRIPRNQRSRRAFLGDRRGSMLRLEFPRLVSGPIRLGHPRAFELGAVRSTSRGVVQGIAHRALHRQTRDVLKYPR